MVVIPVVVIPVVVIPVVVVAMVVVAGGRTGRQGRRERPHLARRHSPDRLVEFWQQARTTHHQRPAFALGDHLAVDVERVVDRQTIPFARFAIDRIPVDALLAQRLHHRIDIRLGHLGNRLANPQLVQVRNLELRQHLEGRGEFEVGAVLELDDLYVGTTGKRKILFLHRLLQAGLKQLGGDLLAQRRAETASHFGDRHLARPEAGQLDLAGRLSDALRELTLEGGRWDGNGHLARQALCRLYRYPHGDFTGRSTSLRDRGWLYRQVAFLLPVRFSCFLLTAWPRQPYWIGVDDGT